jgi:hypothetical protein
MIRPGSDTAVPKGLTLELPLEQLPLDPFAPVLLADAPLAQDSLSLPPVHARILPSAGAAGSFS